MVKLYKAFVLPHFEYASPLFIGLRKGKRSVCKTRVNQCICSKDSSYEELLKIAHIKNLEHRSKEQALLLVYKSIYGQAPNYIQGMFTLRSNGYSLRGHHKVVIPRPTSSYMLHSFKYQASKQWNNLPDKIRTSESQSTFRRNLQGTLLSSSYDCNCMFCKKEVL